MHYFLESVVVGHLCNIINIFTLLISQLIFFIGGSSSRDLFSGTLLVKTGGIGVVQMLSATTGLRILNFHYKKII